MFRILNRETAPQVLGGLLRLAGRAGLVVATLGAGAVWATTTINHQFAPATINPGDTSTYTITIANASLVPLTQAAVTVALPAAITVASPLTVTDTCGFSGAPSSAGGSTLALTNGTIPARVASTDGQCTFSVKVTATLANNWVASIPANTTPTASASGYTAYENAVQVWNTTLANATLAVNTLQAPTGTKSYGSNPLAAGQPTTLTLTLSNPNSGTNLPLTTVTDNLPAVGGAQMVVANPANASVSCTGTNPANGTVSAVPGDSSFSLSGGAIGGAGACTVRVNVVVPALAAGHTSDSFDNIMAIGAIGNTRGLSSASFHQALTVNSPITVSKAFATSPIAAGQPTRLTITIGNASATALPITSFTDSMGAAFKVLTTTSTPVAASANPSVACTGSGAANGTLTAVDGSSTISLDSATAGANGNCTITAYVTSSTDGTQTNTIAANAVVNPAGHSSPAASANLVVNGQITVAKTATVTSVAPGQWTTFNVTINNWSGADVTAVTFTDNLPSTSGQQMVLDTSAAPSAGACSGTFYSDASGTTPSADGDSTLVWKGTVPAGLGASPGVCTISFRARLPVSATSGMAFNNQLPTNTAVTGTGTSGTVVNTNTAARNISTVYAADIGKSFSPTSIAQGGSSVLKVTLYNRTLSPLTNVALADVLPAGLTLAANPAASTTCAGGVVQAFPGGNSLSISGATIAARPAGQTDSSCYFQANVTGTALGGHTNQISSGSMTSAEGATNGSTVTATLTITTGLSGAKVFSPSSVTSGGTTRARITVSNSSASALSNVSVDDSNFSAGLAVANPANATTSCPGNPTLVANPGEQRAQLLGTSLTAGASCDFAFDVQTSGAGPWSNTIPAGKISSAEGPANTAAVSASITAASAQVSINKSFNPVVVTGGVPSRLTIDVINSSGATIHNAAFTDTFPNGMEVYPTPNASTNCAGGTVTAVPGSGGVSLAGATLSAGTCQVYVDVTSVKFLNLTNTIAASAISTDEGYTNATGTTASLSTLQGLGVMKSFAPAYIAAGQTSRLKLRLLSTYDPNALNPVILNNVTFTDNLPAGMSFAASPNATTDCVGPGGSGTASLFVNAATRALTLTGATVTPATSCIIEADVTASAVGVYSNVIAKETVTTNEGVTNPAPAQANLYVVTAPTVSKAFGATVLDPGATTTLTVTIANNNSTALSGVALTDTLPAGLAIANTPTASTSCSNGVATALAGDNSLRLTGATIAANASCSFSAKVVGNTPGTFTNTIAAARITSDQGVSNPNVATATLEIRNPPSVTKAFAPASINAGDTSTLTITLSNPNSTAAALSAALTDALPGNVVVAATPAASKTCTAGTWAPVAGATSVSYSGGSIPANGSCTLSVAVTSSVGPASYTNTIATGALSTNVGKNALPAIATLGVGQPAAPTLSKQFAPATVNVGGTATLTITLGNGNSQALTLTSDLIDTLPGNVVLANPASIGGSCAGATGVAGGNTLTYASGNTIPAGGCTITAQVTSSVAGSYTNTLAAGALVTNGGSNPVSTTAGLVVKAMTPPSVDKAYSQVTINPGGVTQLTISLNNANADPITLSADFVDSLPSQIKVAPSPAASTTCTGTLSAVAGSGSVTLANGATVPSGGCTISVNVTSSTSGGPWINTLAAGSLQTSAGNNGAAAQANLLVNPAQPPSLTKAFSPTLIPAGGLSTLTISLANPNLSTATLLSDLVDTLPAGLRVAATPNVRTSAGCDAAKVSAAANASSVRYLAGATIAADSGCTIAVDVTASTVGLFTNTIATGALHTDVGDNAVAASATLQTLSGPGLQKSFTPTTILTGATTTLRIALANANANPLQLSSALVDTLPAGLVVATPASVSNTCTGSVTANAGGSTVTLASGASIPSGGCTITVALTSTVAGSYTNTLAAGALQTNGGNNPTATSATVVVLGGPFLTKSFSPNRVAPGGATTLTITLGNGNATPATLSAALVDSLPTGLVVAATPQLSTTCPAAPVAVAGASSVSYPSGSQIPPGGCTISVQLTAPKSIGALTNTIAAGALQTDAGNNPQPAVAVLTVSPDLSAIPTLSQWALGLLMLLMAAVGARRAPARRTR